MPNKADFRDTRVVGTIGLSKLSTEQSLTIEELSEGYQIEAEEEQRNKSFYHQENGKDAENGSIFTISLESNRGFFDLVERGGELDPQQAKLDVAETKRSNWYAASKGKSDECAVISPQIALTIYDDQNKPHILLGEMGEHTNFPGAQQFPGRRIEPPFDMTAILKQGIQETTGLDPSWIKNISPLQLVMDDHSNMYMTHSGIIDPTEMKLENFPDFFKHHKQDLGSKFSGFIPVPHDQIHQHLQENKHKGVIRPYAEPALEYLMQRNQEKPNGLLTTPNPSYELGGPVIKTRNGPERADEF